MQAVDRLRERLPEPARDIALNLQSVLTQGALSAPQRWGVALAVALSVGNADLARAVAEDAADPAVIDDARAAAALMAMNNVYYRFRHQVQKPTYSERPARLRMQRLVKPATSKADFELMCLAVSAVNGCESCVRSHERSVLEQGLTEEHVHDAVRLAAVIKAAAVALSF
jgi:alkyl hydroperoxide reductase subunit D